MKNAMTLLLVVGTLACLGGCGARQSTPNAEGPYGVFRNAGIHGVTQREYRIDPPDDIIIKAPDIKEIDGQKQTVRPDGKISLELIGEVLVAGKTPIEVADELQRLAAKYYVQPQVRVEVVANSKFYYVFGFGSKGTGKFPYTGRVTVVSAIADAGYSFEAWPQQIRLSRPGRDGEPNATAVVDFTKIASTGDMKQNYLVEDGDIIEIPYSPLAFWNVSIQQLLGPFTGSVSLVTSPANAAQSVRSLQNK
jgi:polysaccharide export outer membrane protein